MKVQPKLLAPVALLAASALIVVVLVATSADLESTRPDHQPPLVRVLVAQPVTARLTVHAQGTVEPRTESDLVAEISGRIVSVSAELASGGFFAENEVLLRIEPRDYEVALEGARAKLARAQSDLKLAEATLSRQESMGQTGASSRARLDDAIHSRSTAQAGLREAKVAVERAELDLERTEIRAPFAGRVREKHVDVGQFLSRGVSVARIYSVDYAEVRLPISHSDLAFLDLPQRYRDEIASVEDPREGPPSNVSTARSHGQAPVDAAADPEMEAARTPKVTLRADYAGREQAWVGRVVRTEGALDTRTRMINVVARIDDPYARGDDPNRPPLPIGLFVDATIEGRELVGIFAVPRGTVRQKREILVVDAENRIHRRAVEVIRIEETRVLIRSGLEAGERVVTSPLEIVTEGMAVRTTDRAASAGTAAARQDSPFDEIPLSTDALLEKRS